MNPTPHDTATPAGTWSPELSAETYGIPYWSNGYFSCNEKGTLDACPFGENGPRADLYQLTMGLRARGIHTPVIVRFSDMTKHRLASIRDSFDRAIEEAGYQGSYACVFPIKVNQQRQVVEEMRDFGREFGFGLEAGSKPELLALLGMTTGSLAETPIICNGFKDDEYVETVILAAKLGRNITPVVEMRRELDLIIHHAKAHGVRPRIGVRVKPSSTGSGRWESSGGMRSKFGLGTSGLLDTISTLQDAGMADCLKLLHFHVGSQIADVRALNRAVSELAHIYCELSKLGTGLEVIDVGGGLGVDYDGSSTTGTGSINYSIDEYAASVVHRIKSACDDAGVAHPTIVTESGRAMAAYPSVLLVDVPAVTTFDRDPALDRVRAGLTDDGPQPLFDLLSTAEGLETLAPEEALHDATQALDESITLFGMGYMTLEQRAWAERMFAFIGRSLIDRANQESEQSGDPVSDELVSLAEQLSDIYYINCSIFQSLPDSWAIDQVFPVCPIHKLEQKPTRLAALADITCDSDGKIELFGDASGKGTSSRIPLHTLERGEPYYLGIFLVGAYQEVLGDLHNLFGDTHAVHVSLDESGSAHIDHVIEGDDVGRVLSYVGFETGSLKREMRADVERATRSNRLTLAEGRALLTFYEQGLDGYTYLE